MQTKNIALFGATGLIGSLSLQILEKSPDIGKIYVYTRRTLPFATGPKTEIIITDLTNIDSLTHAITSSPELDVALCAIGTTIKKAKNKHEFYKIDHDLVLNIAKVCKQKGIENFGYISSLGANEKSPIYYLQVKGETENDLEKIEFKNLFILRPSLLIGKRNEKRLAEEMMAKILPLFNVFFKGALKKYYPSNADNIAKFFTNKAIANENGHRIYLSDEMIP